MPYDFSFPVSKLNEALAATEPNTEIDVFQKGIYVNLDAVRGHEFIDNIKTQLGFNADDEYEGTFNFVKLLFTGHRGAGKSTELKRMRKELARAYLVVPIDIEKDIVKISAVEPEDLYQLFTLKVVEVLVEQGIPFNFKPFEEIAAIWLKETTFTSDYKTKAAIEGGGEVEVKANLWVAVFKTFIKSSISSENAETRQVRQKIKTNVTDIINRLNVALSELRYTLREQTRFQDVLYIVDGTEKISYDLSKKIFVHDGPLLNQINAHFIFSSPVYGLFDINKGTDFFTQLILPMIKMNGESIEALSQVVIKRVNAASFFDDNILLRVVENSGGSLRQLLRIVHDSLVASRGRKVTQEILNNTVYEMGRRLFEQLSSNHRDVLAKGYAANNNFTRGDTAVKEMLFNLTLLACNGTTIVNPIIQPFIDAPFRK